MTQITVIEADGTKHEIDVPPGKSVMQAIRDKGVRSLLAECGGNLSCATCHGYVDESWINRLPAASEAEQLMIDCALHVQPNSRLTCQIQVTPELEGLIIRLPISQT